MIGQKILIAFQFSYTQHFMPASSICFLVLFYIMISIKLEMKPASQISDDADMNPYSI